MPGWMLTLTTLLLSTPGANKGVKTQSSTPFSNRFTIFHCAVTLISSCISLRPPATQLMRLPECSQIRIASSPLPHGARFSRLSVRIPLTLCLWIPMSNLMRRGYLWDTSRPFIPPCPVVSTSSPRLFPGTKTLTSSLRLLWWVRCSSSFCRPALLSLLLLHSWVLSLIGGQSLRVLLQFPFC